MQFTINPTFIRYEASFRNAISNFNAEGEIVSNGKRNVIKYFEVSDLKFSIKSFKKPNFINAFVYKYLRKSKARRSFEYATFLQNKNIGTPTAMACFEKVTFWGIQESYFICAHLEYVFEYRDLVTDSIPNAETILRQFTQFTHKMHQNGIEFLDHSPGNTLIKDNKNGTYSFYLVDLNRMRFHKNIDFNLAMKNFSRLTPKKEMIAIMSDEYSKLTSIPKDKVFEIMWLKTEEFQHRFFRKKRIKKALKFWKK